jgi:predicted MFS family arabinose efflux permease
MSVFSIAQFRWLFFGNLGFFFAMQGQMLTRTILAWELTGEATSLAYINLVVAIPMIFASLLGGAITDRVERRQLVIIGQCLIVANEIFILTLLLLGQLQFWHLLCTAFVSGCAFPFIMPARMAITATVVGPARLQAAMALSGGVMNLSRVIGPAVMGLVIAQFSFTGAYFLSIALYGMAIFCMFGVNRSRSADNGQPKKPLLADIAYGFSYIRGNRPILICLMFGLIPMFLAMPFQSLLVMLAEQAWGVGESGVGMLMAVGGVGGVLGAIWILRRGDKSQRLHLMIGSTAAFGIFLAIFVQTSNFYLAFIPLLLANMCMSASQTVNNASIQILVDDNVRGRMSSFMMLSFALTPLGVFPMAIAADQIGAASSLFGACIILVIFVAVFYLLSATFRSLDKNVNEAIAAEKSHTAAS